MHCGDDDSDEDDEGVNNITFGSFIRPPFQLLSFPCTIFKSMQFVAKGGRDLHVQETLLERPQNQQIFQPSQSRDHRVHPRASRTFRHVHDCLLKCSTLALVVREGKRWSQRKLEALEANFISRFASVKRDGSLAKTSVFSLTWISVVMARNSGSFEMMLRQP